MVFRIIFINDLRLLLLGSGGNIYVFMKRKLYFGVYESDFIVVLDSLHMKNEMS